MERRGFIFLWFFCYFLIEIFQGEYWMVEIDMDITPKCHSKTRPPERKNMLVKIVGIGKNIYFKILVLKINIPKGPKNLNCLKWHRKKKMETIPNIENTMFYKISILDCSHTTVKSRKAKIINSLYFWFLNINQQIKSLHLNREIAKHF